MISVAYRCAFGRRLCHRPQVYRREVTWVGQPTLNETHQRSGLCLFVLACRFRDRRRGTPPYGVLPGRLGPRCAIAVETQSHTGHEASNMLFGVGIQPAGLAVWAVGNFDGQRGASYESSASDRFLWRDDATIVSRSSQYPLKSVVANLVVVFCLSANLGQIACQFGRRARLEVSESSSKTP